MCKFLHREAEITRQSFRSRAIRELLDGDRVCRDIVRYLVNHSEAADTASGIAAWWIKHDVARTAEALTKLREHGVLRSHLVQDTTSVYTLTKSRLVRETLRQYVGENGRHQAHEDAVARVEPGPRAEIS